MAFLDILRSRKREEQRPRQSRSPKRDALKQVKKTPKSKEEVKPETKPVQQVRGERKTGLAPSVLISPHITEKSTALSGKGIYVFRVSPKTNKTLVSQAVYEVYGFKPKRVRILNMPEKIRLNRGKQGVKPGYKKAIVYLKEGDKIEFI